MCSFFCSEGYDIRNFFGFLSRINLAPHRRDLTAEHLSHHIAALISTYQNPRDFYDHDLLATLDKYLTHVTPYTEVTSFGYSQYLLALCAGGRSPGSRHLDRLLRRMTPDGSFPLGIGRFLMTTTTRTNHSYRSNNNTN